MSTLWQFFNVSIAHVNIAITMILQYIVQLKLPLHSFDFYWLEKSEGKDEIVKVSDERCGNLTAGFSALAHLSSKVEIKTTELCRIRGAVPLPHITRQAPTAETQRGRNAL